MYRPCADNTMEDSPSRGSSIQKHQTQGESLTAGLGNKSSPIALPVLTYLSLRIYQI
jgi:hypothetical protein